MLSNKVFLIKRLCLISISFFIFSNTIFSLHLIKSFRGRLNPKSVHHNGNGLFFAQNMMYQHTITVYNRKLELVKTISDRINLSDYGFPQFKSPVRGGPVEAAFTHNGKYAWITNYSMLGRGFPKPGTDSCRKKDRYDEGFVYVLNTETFKIEHVVAVGSVPKALSASPDNKWVFVANWCSWDLSIIDVAKKKEVKRIQMGTYPRDSVFDMTTNSLYISAMGGRRIGILNMATYKMEWIRHVGSGPRHISLDPDRKFMYVSLKWGHQIIKIDLKTRKVVRRTSTGWRPSSMEITPDGKYLYVVNYLSHTVSKIRSSDLKVMATAKTKVRPIGLAYDPVQRQVWVACYTGYVMVFQD